MTWLLRWSVPIGVVVVALALFPAYRHGIALDGLSYLSIAQSYARGDATAALNGYWSPLYSWLHVPLLVLGVPPLDAATLVQAVIAGLTVLALGALLRTAGGTDRGAWAMSLVLSPLVLAWAHFGVFADLLLAAVLLAVLAVLLHPELPRRPSLAGWTGLLMGVAYLTKLYALPFLAVLLPGAMALHVLVGGVRPVAVVRAGGIILGAFALVAVPWVAALSNAEGSFTVGTAGGHNLELVSPDSRGNPIFYGGLVPPERPGAFSAWEDPTTLPVQASGWQSNSDATTSRLARVVENVQRNAREGWRAVRTQGLAVVVAGSLGALLWVRDRRTAPLPRLGIALALAVYSGGYLLTWVEPRYAWFPLLLLAVPSLALVERIGRSRAGSPGTVAALGLLLLAILPPSVDQLVLRWESGRELDAVIREVAEQGLVEPGQLVASGDNWQRSAILCFRIGCTYLGLPIEGTAELRAARVTRYLLWSAEEIAPPEVELIGGPEDLGGLRVHAGPES